ncbi:type I pantothenate kinase [Polymorphobacter arshaanensis]|uniref:Type I pantothenate kinase n=1 Tax=Glacieibacterium arshaanense TaxID=2511025 RepID=A0A4Y9EKP3_9SPHN|nr:type I pantothenate kinase [Polymorphobacter arshaanensis]TFU01109.1 type I pantothenate kinase [Polymorphobacter arshaanensis]
MPSTDAIATDAADIAARLVARATPGRPLLVGLTGSVAAGKSVLSAAIKSALDATHRVETVSTDGFLLDNATLDARGLTLRKGYPETYDAAALVGALQQVPVAPTRFPGYSHQTYDVDPQLARTIDRPDILLVEGLGLSPLPGGYDAADQLDALIYLDAREDDLEHWFVGRFIGFWKQAENDPTSFYAQFRAMTEPDAEIFARSVWERINLPNLRENIVRARARADIVLNKARDHALTLAFTRKF